MNNPFFQKRASTVVDTDAFRKWFGKSKARDAQGNPIVFYHGTNADFDEFLMEHGGRGTLARDAKGVAFFTSEPDVAEDFSGYLYYTPDGKRVEKRPSVGANIMPVYLKLENPVVWEVSGGSYTENWLADAIREAKEEGHDSVVFKNMRDGSVSTVGPWKKSHVVAVFSPEQVKSATGNSGTFDPADKRITASDGFPGFIDQKIEEKKYAQGVRAAEQAGFKVVRNYDDLPPVASGRIRVYHGTFPQLLSSIKTKGVVPGKETGIGEATPVVLATTFPQIPDGKSSFYGRPTIVVADIDPEILHAGSNDVVQVSRIVPEDIVGIYVPAVNPDWDSVTVDELDEWKGEYKGKTPKNASETLTMADVQRIARELMPVLKPGLPLPEFKIVNSPRSKWLGQCVWKWGLNKEGQPYGADNTEIALQKSLMVSEESLQRIIAHELCHHEHFLLKDKPELMKLGYHTFKFLHARRDGHGSEFKEVANRFNAKYGKDYVTRTSDEALVVNRGVKPYFLLIWDTGKKLVYSQAARLSSKQKAYIERHDCREYRLVRTDDPEFIHGSSIGNGWRIPSTPERKETIQKLWESPDIRIAEWGWDASGEPPQQEADVLPSKKRQDMREILELYRELEGGHKASVKAAAVSAGTSPWERLKQEVLSGIVYHGTTLQIAETIMKDGFRGLNFKAIRDEVLALYGKTIDDCPEDVARILEQSELSYRNEWSLVSTSPSGEVALRWAGSGGEVPRLIESIILQAPSGRDVWHSRVSGEGAVVQARIKNFESTHYFEQAQHWFAGLEKLMAEGVSRFSGKAYTENDAFKYVWGDYSNFAVPANQLEPIRVLKGTELEALKTGLPEGGE